MLSLLLIFFASTYCALPPATTLTLLDDGYPLVISDVWTGIPDSGIDAVFQRANGKIYFFKGLNYWRVTDRYIAGTEDNIFDEGYPRDIRVDWGLPYDFAGVDAIFQRTNGKIYLFSGKKYWRYEDKYFNDPQHIIQKPDLGYPKLIQENFIGIPDDITTAFSRVNGYLYFFKGPQIYAIRDKYVYDDVEEDIVDLCYPKQFTDEFDTDITESDFAIFYRHATDHKLLAFTGTHYYRFTDKYLFVEDDHMETVFQFEKNIMADNNVVDIYTATPDVILERANGFFQVFFRTVIITCTREKDFFDNAQSYPVLDLYCGPEMEFSTYFTDFPAEIQRFDAGFVSSSGLVYLFADDHFYVFPDAFLGATQVPSTETLGTSRKWATELGVTPANSANHIQAAFERANGKVYVFVGEFFWRLTWDDTLTYHATVDAGFPKRVDQYWSYTNGPIVTPLATIFQLRTGTNELYLLQRSEGLDVYLTLYSAVDKNLFLARDCTYPWPQCYSNFECPESMPFCENYGTSYARCTRCRQDDDCAHLGSDWSCNTRNGNCYSNDKCEGNDRAYAIGNDEFVFFARSNDKQCCKTDLRGIFTESALPAPAWVTFDKLPTLFDPILRGSMGARMFENFGTWDGLKDMGFAISATDTALDPETNLADELEEGTIYTFFNSVEADVCEKEFPPEWLPGPPTFYEKAVPLASAGASEINNVFYWEATQHHGAFDVRTLWDCATPDFGCKRTITVTNKLPTALKDVNMLMSFNLDTAPIDQTLENDIYVNWAAIPTIYPWMLNSNGQVREIGTDDTNRYDSIPGTDICSTSVFSGPTTFTGACDSGVSVFVAFPRLEAGQWASVSTYFAATRDIDGPERTYLQRDSNCEIKSSSSREDSAAVFIQVFHDAIVAQSSDVPIPGDCPCVNDGVCEFDIVGKCICAHEQNFGDLCEKTCVNGVHDPEADVVCTCEPGFWGPLCQNTCTCKRGSHCDPLDGSCYCKNGLVGMNCDKVHTCTSGQQ